MADLYGFSSQVVTPVTADKSTIFWGSELAGVMQFNLSYNQQINKRRSMGNGAAIVWASQPTGQITIQKMIFGGSITSLPGFKACNPTSIKFSAKGCNGSSLGNLTAVGCVVMQYAIAAETDGMSVLENVVIDFVALV